MYQLGIGGINKIKIKKNKRCSSGEFQLLHFSVSFNGGKIILVSLSGDSLDKFETMCGLAL